MVLSLVTAPKLYTRASPDGHPRPGSVRLRRSGTDGGGGRAQPGGLLRDPIGSGGPWSGSCGQPYSGVGEGEIAGLEGVVEPLQLARLELPEAAALGLERRHELAGRV